MALINVHLDNNNEQKKCCCNNKSTVCYILLLLNTHTHSRVKFGILLLLYLNPKKIQEIDRDYTFIVIIINQDK